MSKMKYSGSKWIGDIPVEWKLARVDSYKDKKKVYPIGDGDHGTISPDDYIEDGIPYIRVQNLSWGKELNTEDIVYISELVNKKNKKSILYPGDIVIAKTGATIGKINIIPEDMPISNTTSSVGKVSVDKEYSNKYVFYSLLCDSSFQQMWDKASMKSAQPGFNIEDLIKFKICFPKKEEQDLISKFLDEKVGHIDNIIEDLKKQVEILTKYKRQMITEKVLLGKKYDFIIKNGTIKLDVGNTNNIYKIKNILKGMTDGTHGSYDRVFEGEYLLSAKNVFEDGLHLTDTESLISFEDYKKIIKCGYPQKDDILMCCVGSVGRTMIYNLDKPYAFQRSVLFMRPDIKVITPEFLNYVMSSNYMLEQEEFLINKSVQDGLYQGTVKNMYLYLPNISEQKEVVKYLNTKCSEIDKIIEEKNAQIVKMEEYRKSVIYEYVTGKKRVKGAEELYG